jgi:hypothetical protein
MILQKMLINYFQFESFNHLPHPPWPGNLILSVKKTCPAGLPSYWILTISK